MSELSLTGYDNRDANGGRPDEEVYLFDALTDRLICASCNPSGSRPVGVLDTIRGGQSLLVDRNLSWTSDQNNSDHWLAGNIPGWREVAETPTYQPRYLSDSGRLFFNSPDALVRQDSNGLEDVYEYEPAGVGGCASRGATFSDRSGGCVNLISSGTSGAESVFFDASENGDDVFFTTTSRLTSADYDAGYDVYDAHVCSQRGRMCPGGRSISTMFVGRLVQGGALAPAGDLRTGAERNILRHRKRPRGTGGEGRQDKGRAVQIEEENAASRSGAGRKSPRSQKGRACRVPVKRAGKVAGEDARLSRRSVCYGVATAVAAVLLFGGSQAYAAMPWWHLSTLSAPAKAPGGESEIVVEASNLGDAYVNGFEHPVTLVDKLPVGVTATAIYEGGGGQIGVDFASAFSSCSLATLTCTYSGPLLVYEHLMIAIVVKVAPGAGGGVNEVSVSGGGAPSALSRRSLALDRPSAQFGLKLRS